MVARDALPEACPAIHGVVCLDGAVIGRQAVVLAIQHPYDQVVQLYGHPVQACFPYQVLEVAQDGGYVIFVDGLRPRLALAVFPSPIQSVRELDVYAVYARRASRDFGQAGDEYLYVLPEAGVDARAQQAGVNQSLGEGFRLRVATQEGGQVIDDERVDVEIAQAQPLEFSYMVGYDEKAVIAYTRKIHKELKELPHKYGASIGYSMILDDIKTIEDAINEATILMRQQKEKK